METTSETATYRISRRLADRVEFIQTKTARGWSRRARLTPLAKGGISLKVRNLLNTNKIPLDVLRERGWIQKTTSRGIIFVKSTTKTVDPDLIVISKIKREDAVKRGFKSRKAFVKYIRELRKDGETVKRFSALDKIKRVAKKIQQFEINLYTEAPRRVNKPYTGGVSIGAKSFQPYFPQGQALSVVGDVNKLNKLDRRQWQSLAEEDGIQLTETLIDALKSMGEEAYFTAKRLENTRSKWGDTSNTFFSLDNFQASPDIQTTEIMEFKNTLVRDDPQTGHFPSIVSKFMDYNVSDVIIPYKSSYMTEFHQPSLCWLSCIIDPFQSNIEQLTKKREKTFIKLLNYESLAKELFQDRFTLDEIKERGICWNDVKPFFLKFKIKAYLLDIKLQVRDYVLPEKLASNLRPRTLFFVVHGGHVYRLNAHLKEFDQNVLTHDVLILKDKVFRPKHITLPKKTDKKTEFIIVDGHDWLERSSEYVKNALEDKDNDERKKNPLTILLPQPFLQDLAFKLYQYMNIECKIKLKDYGNIDSLSIYNTTFTCVDNHICGSIDFKGKDMTHLEYFFKVFNQTECRFMNREWMSVYHPSVFQMLTTYKPKAISTGTGVKHEKIISWDIQKCYTSIVMNHLSHLQVMNGFDRFEQYDGSALEELNLYLVERLDNKMSYPFNKHSLCYGYNLIAFESQVKIISMLRPSHKLESHLDNYLSNIFNDQLLIESEFSKNPQKWISNTCIGLLNRDRISKTRGTLYSDINEASTFCHERGGELRMVNNSVDTEKLYLHIEDGVYNLKSGFLPIAHFIVDTGNRLIMEMKRDLESCGFDVSNILTDCCITQQDISKENLFKQKFHEKWFDGEFGSIRVEHKNRPSSLQKVRPMENLLVQVKTEYVQPIERRIENEWDLSEIHSLMDSVNRIGIEAIMPGSGKTYCSKKYHMKTLFVVPTNRLRANFLKDGLDAITVCSMLGGDLGREDVIKDFELRDGDKFRIFDYQCLVFDEMFLNNIDTIYRIKSFIDTHGDKFKIVMNYDPFQNKAVGERLENTRDVRQYKLKLIREMCGNYVILRHMKRNTNPENMIHYIRLKELLDRNDKKAMIEYILKNCKTVGRISDIKTHMNISYRNEVRTQISNHIYRMIHGNKPWRVGQVIVYKGKSDVIKGIKGKFNKNVEYTIDSITGKTYRMTDSFGDSFEVPIEIVKNLWVLPYCWTGHAYQGDTIDQPFTIDVNSYNIDCEWLWTALTRTTDWSHINIYFNRSIQKQNENRLRRVISDMIEGHRQSDRENERWISHEDEYITVDYIMSLLNSSCFLCGDPYEIGGGCGSFSIDRIDNHRAHTKDNVRIICSMCNSIKR